MNIVVALTSSSSQLSGVPRHAINLARCLLSRREVSVVDLIVAPWEEQLVQASFPQKESKLHIHKAATRDSALGRNIWYYTELPQLARQLRADLVHLAYPVPVSRLRYHCPIVVSLHDLYPYDIPENFGLPKVFVNQFVLRKCLSEVDAIACVSHDTESRLRLRWHGRFAAKASVIPNVVDALPVATSPMSTVPDTGLASLHGRPFLLCVSQHRKNKNIVLSLQVFSHLLRSGSLSSSTCLLVVGIPGPETKMILKFIQRNQLTSNVLLVKGISEEELRWCYRNCQVLLAPSEIEGFGLPVAEATCIGCRIVCSDIGAFRELHSPHCRCVRLGPNAIESLSAAIVESLHEDVPGPVVLPELSTSAVAAKYLHLYRSLLTATRNAHQSIETASLKSKERQRFI